MTTTAVKATIITGAKGISVENDTVKFMIIGSPHGQVE
ncbi:hypothetical protein ABNIH22_05152 [Acinetobacter baumannii ABNIH22]|nr:hypothetical protein ABNIH1_10953 [Acinetobacter baumannii ABNIH1]EGT98325.1 hypothetical protein ABNIH2_00543 [Acinetobacter baumannii ABNIH2]EGU01506.1 hypothetical protein ABNIH3_02740 [Acinetobacter baumannii ABNIH3]EGU03126.1 hypothetical protein ABNIH4_04470 [Acinetobacter baumannii ABNIH4]EKE65341.1 hypothetical protein B825_04338 [Acinetobacter baumannii ZWS1122]EKE65764.1 hypothetical protein B837_03966 [Acinetobacter baumannii ZWS1219]EME53848.1 hypothetical protein G347_14793 [A